ncbi:cytochrome c-type biogenesis protein CcmH [Devosia enhydra]|uniref:Cytochrome c-type biogenesis protein CcmH n=1 Tax=Devosia enhydra TaxID=665118 RepID=A0A1K2I288_9HYPH|nr:c-type cytochrome biogenesis protein CcmI [Devosia enhydra]SFZ85860.1 cytochrome c-type biogenesis protein CcmH [Devosia enhydra]
MVFWTLAIAMTVCASAALYYASARRTVNASSAASAAPAMTAHLRLQLAEIEADLKAGRLDEAQAVAARAELAREVLRVEAESAPAVSLKGGRSVVALSSLGAAVLAFAVYAGVGQPNLPAQPLAQRPTLPAQMTMDEAVARIEAELERNPQDVRGWRAVAPAYMQMGRAPDAARAFRRILELAPVTADAEIDLAEALMVAQNGSFAGEPLELLTSAATRDPTNTRALYYLAGEATTAGRFAEAAERWQTLIDSAQGSENWLPAARQGLEAAITARDGMGADAGAVQQRVADLAARLETSGGTVAEWAQLVRSYLVLNDRSAAITAYQQAMLDHPDAGERIELDRLAADSGLLSAETRP